MKSKVTSGFWKLFEHLPKEVQAEARSLHLVWRRDPYHTSLHFKKVGVSEGFPVYSIRIGRKWRALGILEDDTVKWLDRFPRSIQQDHQTTLKWDSGA